MRIAPGAKLCALITAVGASADEPRQVRASRRPHAHRFTHAPEPALRAPKIPPAALRRRPNAIR